MRYLVQFAIFALVALTTGFGLSYFTLERGSTFGSLTIGPWVAWPSVGTSAPDPYSRAYAARSSLLPLNFAEGIVFTAKTDSSGDQLQGNCAYRIEGEVPSAALWTLVVTNQQGNLLTVPDSLAALNSQRLLRRDDDSFVAHISADSATENWLEIIPSEQIELVLTLYEASDFAGIGEQVQPLPAIILERCTS